jgi:hypothetical protein
MDLLDSLLGNSPKPTIDQALSSVMGRRKKKLLEIENMKKMRRKKVKWGFGGKILFERRYILAL